ncbi:hypothetical protein [Streptomyces sp. NPDC060187]|uniref:hypothetical protein n=1 Tax=Streptomyces sp. NPDC060187 TaxID=3347067 RepID=UPI003654FC39
MTGLLEESRDFDRDAWSGDLFEDHDVLMPLDDALDGIEDGEGEVNPAVGVVNLAPRPVHRLLPGPGPGPQSRIQPAVTPAPRRE